MAITYKEMLNKLLRKSGQDTISGVAAITANTIPDDIRRILLANLFSLYNWAPWPFRLKTVEMRTEAKYEVGTAATTAGSATISNAGGADWTGYAGYRIRVDDINEVFGVNSSAAGTITADVLAPAADASSTYVLFKDVYVQLLTEAIVSVSIADETDKADLDIITPEEFFRRKFSRATTAYTPALPRQATFGNLLVPGNINASRCLLLDPPPDKVYQLRVTSYGRLVSPPSADADYLDLPDRMISCLEQMAMGDIYRDILEDPRGMRCWKRALAMIQGFMSELDQSSPQAGMYPLTSDRQLQNYALPSNRGI